MPLENVEDEGGPALGAHLGQQAFEERNLLARRRDPLGIGVVVGVLGASLPGATRAAVAAGCRAW